MPKKERIAAIIRDDERIRRARWVAKNFRMSLDELFALSDETVRELSELCERQQRERNPFAQ